MKKICRDWSKSGRCSHGAECRFLHDQNAMVVGEVPPEVARRGRGGGGGGRGYFICVRLPVAIDSSIHSFIDRTCDAADLLDNHGRRGGAKAGIDDAVVKQDLHVTFTRRIDGSTDKEVIKRVVKEEASIYSKAPIKLTFDELYVGRVNRIEHSEVHCIGISLSSPELDTFRSAVSSKLDELGYRADKGYPGAGHISMAYFPSWRKDTYEARVGPLKDSFLNVSFELTEVEIRNPDGSSEKISLI